MGVKFFFSSKSSACNGFDLYTVVIPKWMCSLPHIQTYHKHDKHIGQNEQKPFCECKRVHLSGALLSWVQSAVYGTKSHEVFYVTF